MSLSLERKNKGMLLTSIQNAQSEIVGKCYKIIWVEELPQGQNMSQCHIPLF